MKKEYFLIIFISLLISSFFFYKTVFLHQIPFPGDLLINQSPYKTESFLGYAPGGYPNIAQGMDVITEMYPWKYFTIQELKKGRIPLWNPHNFSGNLHMQNYQTAVFYPFNIFFFLFSFASAWSLFIFFQPFLAMLLMYLFLRSLNLHRITSLIGAIAFGFSSYMSVWMEYGNIGSTVLWLPLVLFSLRKFIQKPAVIYFLLSIGALTMSFLAGYIQGVFYIYIVAIAFVGYLGFTLYALRFTLNMYVALFLIFFLPILLTTYLLLPTYDLFSLSTRSPYSLSQIENLLQPVFYWVTIFASDFFGNPAHRNFFLPITYIERVMYIGIPLIFFSFLSVAKVRNRDMKFFLIVGSVFLIITTNLPLIKYLYLIPIPMISTTVPTRALSIFIFCMIIVGCFGIEYWILQKKYEKTILPFLFLGIYGFLWISVFIFPNIFPNVASNRSITLHNLVIPSLFALLTVAVFYIKQIRKLRFVSLLTLVLLVIVDLFLFFQKITPFAPAALLYPRTPVISYIQKNAGINRFWGYGSAYIPSNFQTYDGTYAPEGNDPLHIKDYGILLASSANGKYPNLLPRPDANIASGYGISDLRNPYRQKILNLLGVKYVLFQDNMLGNTLQPHYDMFPEESYNLIWQQKTWQVYENKQVLPRFFLATQYILAGNIKDALAKIYITDLSKTLILATKPSQAIDAHATGTVSLSNYLPDRIQFQTQTNGNELLFLSDNYFHSWKGKVDNQLTPVYKADMTFRALVVPKGKHTVTIFYAPFYFPIGLAIALCAFIFLVFYSFYFYQYVQNVQKK